MNNTKRRVSCPQLTKLTLILTLLLGWGSQAWGDETMTYYPGATAGSEYVPFRAAYSNKANNKSEFIIPSKDLSALAGKKITKLTFYEKSRSTGFSSDIGSYKVILQEVSDSIFSEAAYLGNYDSPVFNGTITNNENTWTITLSKDFVYTGTKHLLIGFCYNGNGTNTKSLFFYCNNFGSGKNKALYPNYSGNATNHAYVPKTTFTYEEAGDEPVSVSAPTDLTASNITPISTELTWTNGGEETTWQLCYSTESGDHSTTTSDFTTKPYTLSGLTYNTKYYVSIRAKKSSTYSDWSDEISFTTADAVAVTSVTVDPTEWEMVAGDTKTLTATVSPNDATIKDVTWESSNTSVATVTSSGVVTAVAPGEATITVTSTFDGTKTATCDITVVSPVTPTAFKAKELLPNYAYLTWTNGSDEDTWQIKYGTTSGSLNNQSSDLTDKPHLLTNLSANTTYYASIRSKLGTAYSAWSDEISFTTPSIGSSPSGGSEVTEDFNSDWSTSYGSVISSVKEGWGYVNGYARYYVNSTHKVGDSGNGLYATYQSASPYFYIVTPYIEAGSTISFYYKYTESSTGYIRFYKATKAGSTYYVNTGTQYGSSMSGNSTSGGEMTELAEPITITDGGYVAIYLSRAAIDNFTYTHLPNVSVITDNNGFTTFANSNKLDLTETNLPSGLEAYKAKVEGSLVKFTQLDQNVPANTGILLKGNANTEYRIAIASTSSDVEDNELLVNTGGSTFDATSGYTYFAMKKNSDPLTFATFAPGTTAIPANKAYLKVLTSSIPAEGRALTCVFDDEETTGIKAVSDSKFMNSGYYNLAGQRVVQPTKGLYIVNGKKYVVK